MNRFSGLSSRVFCATFLVLCLGAISLRAAQIYVSPTGNDSNPGTFAMPIATLAHAQELARTASGGHGGVTVILRAGTYYLTAPLVFTSADSGQSNAPVIYQAFGQEKPVISGARRLDNLAWQPYQNGILQAQAPADLATDQLFVNGEQQILARYPNYNPKETILNGFAADAWSPARAARWKDPTGGYMHAIQDKRWGSLDWEILDKKPDNALDYKGGWQTNRGNGPHGQYRFVENIFEELDSPGEWYLNPKSHLLFYYPPTGVDPSRALIEAPALENLVQFQGSEQDPVKFVSLKGLTFHHTLRTFMKTKEGIMRSDWAIYRNGAIFINGAEDCSIENSDLSQLGGTAIFVNNYNRRITIRGCHIHEIGANAVIFLGDPKAAQNPSSWNMPRDMKKVDLTPGPKTNNYPAECLVDDCLIHDIGRWEKQVAGVGIDLSSDITVRHCSIYDCPRAGINIGDGCWGGDIIEFCDVFDTVKETGDHGSFNSWGRDRWWGMPGIDYSTYMLANPDLPKLDMVKTNILRNSRWRCDHGWDIDLDDGSSNYIITNNLCLHGGIKNRDGFYRVDTNNIMIGNSFNCHVWHKDSQDVFSHNIVSTAYAPIAMFLPWGKEVDYNFWQTPGMQGVQPAKRLQEQSGRDEHSEMGDAMFIDPAHGNYDVKPDSPVLALGFVNFPMDQFGVMKPELRAIARTPVLPDAAAAAQETQRDGTVVAWGNAQVRNIENEGEMSVYALPGVTGVLVTAVTNGSSLQKAGLRANDVILGCNGGPVTQVSDLAKPANAVTPGKATAIIVSRSHQGGPVTLQVGP